MRSSCQEGAKRPSVGSAALGKKGAPFPSNPSSPRGDSQSSSEPGFDQVPRTWAPVSQVSLVVVDSMTDDRQCK